MAECRSGGFVSLRELPERFSDLKDLNKILFGNWKNRTTDTTTSEPTGIAFQACHVYEKTMEASD